MRILMVQTYYYFRGGDSTYMLKLAELLEQNGHDVVPFAMHDPRNLQSPYSDYFVSEIDFPSLLEQFSPCAAWNVLTRSIYSGEARDKVGRLVDDVGPDVAHFHNIHGHLTTSIIAPIKKRGIPIVWTLHDFRQLCPNSSFLCKGEICERCLPNRFYEVVLHRCKKQSLSASFVAMLSMYYERLTRVPSRIDRFVTPSKFLKGKLVEGGFEPERITWIPNFVDLDSFGGGPEGDYFLYMGRLSFDKGLDTLIRAVAGLERGELWIAGEGPHREHLQRLTLDLGTERVKFIGYRDHAEIGRILVKAQFVVLPSRSYENLPFSIMEAFASGKPVIASNVGGIPEMVDDGVNGFLFQIGDTVALTDRIRRLIHDPALRREMGQRGREKAEEIYNRNRHYERIMEVYGEVTGKGS